MCAVSVQHDVLPIAGGIREFGSRNVGRDFAAVSSAADPSAAPSAADDGAAGGA